MSELVQIQLGIGMSMNEKDDGATLPVSGLRYQVLNLEATEFLNNLVLYTEENKFNYATYLLADENGISMKVAKYSGIDKVGFRKVS